MVLSYKARSRKLGAAVLVLALAAMLMATGLPGKLEKAHATWVEPTTYTIGFHTPAKITKLIYPTLGDPAIMKQNSTFTIEWDPRKGNLRSGTPPPTCSSFEVTATSTNGGNGAITKALNVGTATRGYSAQWPTLTPIPGYDTPANGGMLLYLVPVTVPSDVPADLYDLTVSCIIDGTRYQDTQTNSMDVVQEFKDKFNFIQMTDIHVYPPEDNYISGNTHERQSRSTTWNATNGYGATYYAKEIQEINRIHPDFVVYTGDYDFGQKYEHKTKGAWGDSTENEFEQEWFYQETQKLEVPVFIVIGNHDGYNYSFTRNGSTWTQDWQSNWTRLYGPLYYTFNYGPDYKFFAVNGMDWSSGQRTLQNYFNIILQPAKYLGDVAQGGDTYAAGIDWNRTGAREQDVPLYTGQLGWLRDQLAASQGAKSRVLCCHYDPWKDNGSGSMWASGTDPITGGVFPMGDGVGRMALLRLVKDYKVQLMLHGHDHSDCISTDDADVAQLDWTAGGGQVISANTTSASFQADGNSPEYPGYRRVWIDNGNVLQAPAGAESLNYVEPYHSWPAYAGTTVGGTTNLHNLSVPALQQSWSATPGASTEDVSCSLTSAYNKPLTGAYLEFPMKYLTGGRYYTVSNGTFGETFDVSGSVRMNQVYTDMNAGQSNKVVRVYKCPTPDTNPPSGSILINNGDASTEEAAVTLTLGATDTESGVGEMMVSNSSDFSGARWQRYQTSLPWTLSAGTGLKTVYVKYRDRAMPPNVVTVSDSIQFNAPPSNARITGVSPNSHDAGFTFTLTVTGTNTNFVQNTTDVTLTKDGNATGIDVYSATVTNPTTMTVQIHVSATCRTGRWDVGATGPGTISPKLGGFTVTGNSITGVSPDQGTKGTSLDVNITGTGTGFVNTLSVAHFWRNGVDIPGLTVISTTVADQTHCTAHVSITNGCNIGLADVSVYTRNTAVLWAAPLEGGFEIVEHVPRIVSLSPQSSLQGQTLDVNIVASDTTFVQGTSYADFGAGIDATSVPLTVSDNRHATAHITIAPGATPGPRNVNVITGTETPAALIGGFTVEYPAPTIVRIYPTTATNSGPVNITNLTGTGFRTGATVKLSKSGETDVVASNVVVVSDTRITCTLNLTGKHGGAWDVVVANTDMKSDILAEGFTVDASPTISSITPASGVNTGSVSITNLAGTNFYSGATVKLTSGVQTINATNVMVVSTSKITCTFDLTGASIGQWNVVYSNTDQPDATLTNGFWITGPPPTLASIAPNVGTTAQSNFAVTNLAGSNFRAGAAVKLTKSGQPNITATNVTPNGGGTSLTCDLDLTGKRVGAWNVVVTNTDTTSAALTNGFTLSYPGAPTVATMSQSSGLQGESVTGITITGTNFYNPPGSTPPVVKLIKSGQPDIVATNVQLSDANHLRCDFDLSGAAQADWVLTVTNDDGQSGTWGAGNTFHVIHGEAPQALYVIPPSGPIGSSVTITGSHFGVTKSSSWVSFNGKIASPVGCSWDDSSITCKVPTGATTGKVKVHTVSGESVGPVFTVTSGAPPTPTKTEPTPIWYLAEGTTDYGFATYINIENPNTTPVTALVTYMTKSGPRTRAAITLPAMSQTVVNPANDIGATDFSTKVECKEGKTIAVDRRMLWTGPGAPSQEGHSSVGVTAPAKTWYLAEGSSKWGFESWLLIQNPGTTLAHCTVTYMIEGQGPVNVPHDVAAGSRASFSMATEPGVGAVDASIKVVSDVPVIPERAMYRNNRREGHDSIGTTTPAKDYYLAEGTTDWGFTTYCLVQNPNASPATVNITYMTPKGPVSQAPFTMEANSRKTINVNNLPGMSKTDCSIHVQGSLPIIGERAMYWGAGTPLGEACHDSIGMSSPHTAFYLPDGETYNGMETWTLVQNPNKINVTVEIKYLTPDGKGIVTFNDIVPANSRKTYNMADKIGAGRAAIMVTSRTTNGKIMVERSMYWNNRGAGTDTIGGFADL